MAASAVFLTGCATSTTANPSKTTKTLKVVTNSYAAYDWTKMLLKDSGAGADITYLLENGIDLHSFQPSVEDMQTIADSDLLIYVGGESDGWVADAIENTASSQLMTVNMLESIGDLAKAEELGEGMTPEEHDHDHGHEDEDDHDHEEEHDHAHEDEHEHEEHEEEADHAHTGHEHEDTAMDEHVWLSLRNAKHIVTSLAKTLETMAGDEAIANKIAENEKAYQKQLDDLDKQYDAAIRSAGVKTIVVADRFPFRYLVEDYGIQYYAAFLGCSAETEASFNTVKTLSEKVKDMQLKNVMVIENSDQKLAGTIIQNSGEEDVDVLVLDSIQSVSSDDIKNEASYLHYMEQNLEVLKKALNNAGMDKS